MVMADQSPLMEQYDKVKAECQDSVLLFRLGDFYEMFREDAIEVSSLLNLTLTKRNGQPMCGMPYHSARSYIARLVRLGRRVAVCEQLSPPGKGIIERKIVERISPGTLVDEDYLEKAQNNYLLALAATCDRLSLMAVDLSTGELEACAWPLEGGSARLAAELFRYGAREILVQQSLTQDPAINQCLGQEARALLSFYPDWSFSQDSSYRCLTRILGTANLKGFGLSEDSPEVLPAQVLVGYLEDTAKALLSHVRGIRVREDSRYMHLDAASQRNLEICHNQGDGSRRFSLLEMMDETRTAMGARLLRNRLQNPLREKTELEARLDRLQFYHQRQDLLGRLREGLARVLDIERLSGRLAMDKAHPRDVLALGESIRHCLDLEAQLRAAHSTTLVFRGEDERIEAIGVMEKVGAAIMDEPSILLSEGRIIRDGYSTDLDELRKLHLDSHEILEDYLARERSECGIPSLRLKRNNIIGYYLELGKSHASSAPPHFIRRQSVVGGERFTTEALAELGSKIEHAQEKIVEVERSLFVSLRDGIKPAIPTLKSLAHSIAEIDCESALAYAATRRLWTRPELHQEVGFSYSEGRHPVVEAYAAEHSFVPNDLDLGFGNTRFALVTGPNMAGKSTYLRQSALICLMAQVGSFVPASQARLGLVDRLYCRVGAQDSLAKGESTFLVEMNETANILNTASEHSLVIMDEVGRGTSTQDGLAIAQAVAEELALGIKPCCLFATHYHELSRLEGGQMLNLRLDVLEQEGQIVFLKKVRPGAAGSSYGLHVARLAGLPEGVLSRAKDIMTAIGQGQLPSAAPLATSDDEAASPMARQAPSRVTSTEHSGQTSLFPNEEMGLAQLRSINLEETTPIEALQLLVRLKKIVEME